LDERSADRDEPSKQSGNKKLRRHKQQQRNTKITQHLDEE